jgi:hypothetical protein
VDPSRVEKARSSVIKLYWLAADQEVEILAGKWPAGTPIEREGLEDLAMHTLLEQCSTEDDRQEILNGSLHWVDSEDD